MTQVFVVFKQGDRFISRIEAEDLDDAQSKAKILNDGLTEEACDLGFRHVVEVKQ